MGFSNDLMLDEMQKRFEVEAEKELKANRKKNGKWEKVSNYPCPNQCLAIRKIAPMGRQSIFRTTKKVKSFLWFKKNIPIKIICTEIMKKSGDIYFWKEILREEIQ